MEDFGYIYIPPQCEPGNESPNATLCLLHIFFHGCTMQPENIGTDFITTIGFPELADANDLVVLFPSTIGSLLAGNPNGCFNWVGYLGDLLFNEFATKEAVQMKGVFNMMARWGLRNSTFSRFIK